jgi:hypothetical protein
MTLIICPECAHEVSTAAEACPNCGRVMHPPAPVLTERKVVMAPRRERDGFPKWAIIPIVLLSLILMVVLYAVFSRDDDGLSNVNVNVNAARAANTRAASGSSTTTIDPSTATIPSAPGYVPPASSTSVPSTSTTVPGEQTSVPPTRGSVTIDAKVITTRGATQPVRNEKFYLLERDIESILSNADLDPIEGQSLTNSLGLALLYPGRYGDFRSRAMAVLNRYVKYSGQTDASGKAKVGNVEPGSYYLFGMTKSGTSFAVWSSPVSIQPGDNNLNLSPARLTAMQEPQD